MSSPPPNDMQWCADECLRCYRICMHSAMKQCLEAGGRHVEPTHFRMLVNCASLCQTVAEFLLGESPLHPQVCAACAQVCDACADSCEAVGGLEECVQACRACAAHCRRWSGGEDEVQGSLLAAQHESAEAGQLRL